MTITGPVFAANWKMHMSPRETREFFARFLDGCPEATGRTIAFFPPSISFAAAEQAVSGRSDIRLGVQNIHWEDKGAFTGETSAGMAIDAGAQMALVGHSERRQLFGETDDDTARKTRAALSAGLVPVLCVGETLQQREGGEAADVVERQLRAVYQDLSGELAARLLIAYEPVWAIGTGRTASPQDAEEMHGRIRSYLRTQLGSDVAAAVPILYGGSVKPDNAGELLAASDVNGVLVGGASLDPQGFARICQAAG